jgi:hypothetical protein
VAWKSRKRLQFPLLASRQWLALELHSCCMIFRNGSDMSGGALSCERYLREQRPLEVPASTEAPAMGLH